MSLIQNLLRLVPISILLRTLQIRPMVSVQVLKDTVLILQAPVYSFRRWIILYSGKTSRLLRRRREPSGGRRCYTGGRERRDGL